MQELLNDLFTSKKFVVFITGCIALLLLRVAPKLGLVLTQEDAAALSSDIVKLGAAYLIGQGAADLGKHAAEVKAGSDAADLAATIEGKKG